MSTEEMNVLESGDKKYTIETNNPHPYQDSQKHCFLYDVETPPSRIEKLFGEPFHVKNKYPDHQISLRFIITLAAVYIVEGCIDWILLATRYYGAAVWDIGPSEMQRFRTIGL